MKSPTRKKFVWLLGKNWRREWHVLFLSLWCDCIICFLSNLSIWPLRKTGVDGADIWLSIVGEVYDVTMGKDYYAPGSSYGAFAGRDASIPFCTGKFTAEEAEKNTEVLKSTELPGLVEWRDFYRAHNVYKFVGKLIDPRYYDDMGEPTPDMMVLQKRIQEARAEQALKSKIRREERLKKQKEKEAAQAKS